MSTLDDAKMPSLKDKHLALEVEEKADKLEKVELKEKSKKLKVKKN